MLWGLIPGIILPLTTLIIIWVVKYDGGFFEFLKTFQQKGLLSKVISLAAIPNLLLFFPIYMDRPDIFIQRGYICNTSASISDADAQICLR